MEVAVPGSTYGQCVKTRKTETNCAIVEIINGQADNVRHKIIQIAVRLPPQIETLYTEKKGSRLCRSDCRWWFDFRWSASKTWSTERQRARGKKNVEKLQPLFSEATGLSFWSWIRPAPQRMLRAELWRPHGMFFISQERRNISRDENLRVLWS